MTGEELRKKREELGLTQQDLASRLGISYATIYRWEKEKVRPNKIYARLLEEFFESLKGKCD